MSWYDPRQGWAAPPPLGTVPPPPPPPGPGGIGPRDAGQWALLVGVAAVVAMLAFATGVVAGRLGDEAAAPTTSAPPTTSAARATTSPVTLPRSRTTTVDTDGADDAEGVPNTLGDEGSGTTAPTGPFEYTLTVHTDGCGVIRTDGGYDGNLEWDVFDEDGFQVLGRLASGETRYRYFRSGTYTVVLREGNRAVSNTVTIRC